MYGTGPGRTVALDDVSLGLQPGESLALTGPSGSGKSTLIRVLAGLQVPDRGTVSLGTERLSVKNALEMRRNHIGLVFQDYRLVPFLSAEENILLANEMSRRPKPASADVDALLNGLGLGDLRHRPCHTLSGGEQQRVAIARALIGRPRVILADEPTGALDGKNSADVAGLLSGLATTYGVAVVVATHDRDVAASLDREFIIDRALQREPI